MAIGGSKIKDTNSIFRMFIVVFAGIMAFAVLLSWRSQILFNAEYVDLSMSPSKVHEGAGIAHQHNDSIKQELKPDINKE